MWKLLLGFVVFAAPALYGIKQSGGDIDMGGEKHDVTGGHSDTAASAPASSASPALPASAAASK